jgi:hypothetical protein
MTNLHDHARILKVAEKTTTFDGPTTTVVAFLRITYTKFSYNQVKQYVRELYKYAGVAPDYDGNGGDWGDGDELVTPSAISSVIESLELHGVSAHPWTQNDMFRKEQP